MIQFNKKYFLLFTLLLLSEILIAKYATGFIRHTFGDYLVVILVYAFIKSFIKMANNLAAILTLIIAFCVEFLQLTNLQNYYPIAYAKEWRIILGTSFSIGDLVAYFFGFLTIIVLENSTKYWYETK
jgi:hypothetical protein